jgi:hypothetical protein
VADRKIVPFVNYHNGFKRVVGIAEVEIKDGFVTASVTIPDSHLVKSVEQITEVTTLGISVIYVKE